MGIIRFTLALIVLATHAGFWPESIGARASVQVFFVLSGIYMAAVYTTKYRHVEHSALTFYMNRALRLWPTYLFLLALTTIVWFAAGDLIGNDKLIFNLFANPSPNTGWMAALTLTLFGQDIASVNETLHYMLPVRQSWSIGSELLFYLTVPFILRKPHPKMYFIGFVLLMGFKYAAVKYTGGNDRLSYFFPLGNYGYFLLGCGLYFVSIHPRIERVKELISPVRWVLLGALLLLLLLAKESSFESGLRPHMFVLAVFSLAAVLLFERSVHPVGSLLGNLSYGIYLNHFLFIGIFSSTGLQGMPLFLATAISSVSLSFLTERVVQKPIDRYRYRNTRNKSPSQMAINPPEPSRSIQGESA